MSTMDQYLKTCNTEHAYEDMYQYRDTVTQDDYQPLDGRAGVPQYDSVQANGHERPMNRHSDPPPLPSSTGHTRSPKQPDPSPRVTRSCVIVLGVIVAVLVLTVIGVAVGLTWPSTATDESVKSPTLNSTLSVTVPSTTTSTEVPGAPSLRCDPQCGTAGGCITANDPTTCTSCLNYGMRIGIHNFCVQSCESVGSVTESERMCRGRSLTNVALVEHGATCEASSTNGPGWECENVMDGTVSQWSPPADGAGEWIQINIPEQVLVLGIEIDSRSAYFSQCLTYDIILDGSPQYRIEWECTDHRQVREYFFSPTSAKTFRIKCHVDCGVGGAQGFRGIKIYTLT